MPKRDCSVGHNITKSPNGDKAAATRLRERPKNAGRSWALKWVAAGAPLRTAMFGRVFTPTLGQLLGLLLISWVMPSASAWALPATIAWDVPLQRYETYFLEVAATPGFAVPLLSTQVKGTGYLWQAPAEGVYHWRLTRPGVKSGATGNAELSNLASGSFAVIDPALKREQPARLYWEPAAGADHYKIFVLDAADKQRVMTVTATSYTLPKLDIAEMIEVVPFTEGHRASRSYHLDPTLRLISGVPPPPPVASLPLAAAVPVVSARSVTESQEPRRRMHLVYLFGEAVQERMEVQKQSIDLVSTTLQGGGGGGFWLNPVAGLIVSGQADYHEHNDNTITQPALFPSQHLTIDQSRFTGDLSVGYNILDFFDVKRVLLTIAGAGAITQIPLVDFDYAGQPPATPPMAKQRLSLLGGSGSLGYLGNWGSGVFEAGGMTESADSGRLVYERLIVEFYVYEQLSLILEVFHRDEQASHCAGSIALCLTVGTSSTTTQESGAMLGLGIVRF